MICHEACRANPSRPHAEIRGAGADVPLPRLSIDAPEPKPVAAFGPLTGGDAVEDLLPLCLVAAKVPRPADAIRSQLPSSASWSAPSSRTAAAAAVFASVP